MAEPQAVDIQALIDESPFTGFQMIVVALCCFVVMLDGFDTAAIGYIAPALSSEWSIARADLAPVLSAALFGLAFGALVAGPLADRFGRKAVLVGAVFLFGAACLSSSFAGTLSQLTLWRLVTGLGLGAAMPNAVTLTSEFCPARRRATITNAMFCGFPIGAAFGGFLAAWMIPLWGWRSVLILGGIAPLLLCALLLAALPESIRYMVARGLPVERIRAVLGKIVPRGADASSFAIHEAENAGGLALFLSKSHILGTIMLWIAYFMGLVIFYALINWMPILFRDAGLSPGTASLVSALFPLGGIGAILAGVAMDRFNGNKIVALGFALTALFIFLIGRCTGQLALLMVAVFTGGALMNTAQCSLPALAASFYPTRGRATGVAWMLGIGRFGGIAGSFLVAELSRRQLGFSDMFGVIAIPGLIAALALLLKQYAHPERAVTAQPVAPASALR